MSSKMASASSTSSSSPSAASQVAGPSSSSSTSPHLCLRWNNYQSNLTSVFDQLLQNETFVDVTLAADGHAIKAHRMVLSACSPYFQHLFFDNPCQHPIVILKDTRWPELKAIVEYMYRGEISVAQEELTSLLRVAETLKIRGLSELNNDHRRNSQHHHASTAIAGSSTANAPDDRSEASPLVPHIHPATRRMVSESPTWPLQSQPWPEESGTPTPSPSPAPASLAIPVSRSSAAKRRRVSGSESPVPVCPSPAAASTPGGGAQPQHEAEAGNSMDHHDTPLSLVQQAPQLPMQQPNSPAPSHPLSLPGSLSQHPLHSDDLDIKPGIAELIREEERARMLEGTHPWLTASPSVLSDTYQYQLQALWQKAWATGQGVMQNLRFRERGPFKTWRPETMAEAIMAVLREGLSLSQAARKFDIPYPTFVLYANRVNNMLGPSADGAGSGNQLMELRPKGRGRPQRILTGSWPEDHVHGVIRAVVFRDPSSLPRHIDREDASKLTANRASTSMSRLLVHPVHPQSIPDGTGMRGLIQSAMNNGNNGHHHVNHEFALPSSSSSNMSGTYGTHHAAMLAAGGSSSYPPSMRSMPGPSSGSGQSGPSNGIIPELMTGNAAPNGAVNNNNNISNNNSIPASSSSGGGLTSSSLFNALQQEVAEETRLAALNAMTQRLMSSLEGENFGLGNSMSCQQQRSSGTTANPAVAAAAAAALEAAAWFGPNGSFTGQLPMVELAADDVTPVDDEDEEEDDEAAVQHLATFGVAHSAGPAVAAAAGSTAPHGKQEQIFGD